MQLLSYLMAVFLFHLPAMPETAKEKGKQIIQKSIQKHDPNGQWPSFSFKAHIQEPRPSVPHRYSIVHLDYTTGYFQLDRNREDKMATYIVDANGENKVLIDQQSEFPKEWEEQYRLGAQMPAIYKRSYFTMYGLPMTLNEELIKEYHDVNKVVFNQEEAYQIDVTLREALFTKNWSIFISRKDYRFLGLEMYDKAKGKTEGERLYFEGEVQRNGITIPRIKHWYDLGTGAYSGSDVLLKLLD